MKTGALFKIKDKPKWKKMRPTTGYLIDLFSYGFYETNQNKIGVYVKKGEYSMFYGFINGGLRKIRFEMVEKVK